MISKINIKKNDNYKKYTKNNKNNNNCINELNIIK